METREEQSVRAAPGGAPVAIRRTLNDYMERHGIGIAELARRIAQGAGRTPGDVSDTKLLRFLAGREPAAGELAGLCAAFAERQTEALDPAVALGDALAGFGQCDRDEERRAAVCGTYEVTVHLPAIESYSLKDPAVPHGTISFEPIAGRPFLRAAERAPDRSAIRLREEVAPDHVFEGVALMQAHGLAVFLRDTLTRRPKTYVLDAQAAGRPGAFAGIATTPAYDGRTGAGGVVQDVTLAPKGGG
ncbi:MAG: hypothetical protein AB7U47_12975 [Variibacter sp.]